MPVAVKVTPVPEHAWVALLVIVTLTCWKLFTCKLMPLLVAVAFVRQFGIEPPAWAMAVTMSLSIGE